ncbi:MAG: hypothetical protein JWM51_1380, partial [Microbacteriaceae bacterium]|nr:hypothetical protein [Microbacteriaceae bacterium]
LGGVGWIGVALILVGVSIVSTARHPEKVDSAF